MYENLKSRILYDNYLLLNAENLQEERKMRGIEHDLKRYIFVSFFDILKLSLASKIIKYQIIPVMQF